MAQRGPLKVVVLTSLPDALLQRIVSLDQRLEVADAAALLLNEIPAALRPGQSPPPVRVEGRELDDLLAEAEVVLAARRLPADLAFRAPRLRWVQLPMAGVEWVKNTDLWSSPKIAITGAAGINATQVAEYVLMAMLALAKDLPRMLASKGRRQWDRFDLGQLRGKTLGIVGYGAIGQEAGRLAGAFGMNVLATKRRIEPGAPPWVLPVQQLDRLLRESDYVLLSVPATPETSGMIGPEQLAAMRPTAYLVNISRGSVVDEAALIEALRAGRLAGAALDVFRTEPLPADSSLWEMPNVLISAHIAGLFEQYDAAVVDLFAANMRRYLDGQPLVNQVDRRAGY